MWYWAAFFIVAIAAMLATSIELWLIARREPEIRRWMIVAALSAAALPVGIVAHNVLSAAIGGEEAVTFMIALLIAPSGFVVGVLGSGLALLPRDRALAYAVLLTGAGMGLFAVYSLFALFVTALIPRDTPYGSASEFILLPTASLAMVAGALSIGGALMTRRRTSVASSTGAPLKRRPT